MSSAEFLTKKPENVVAELRDEWYDRSFKDTDFESIMDRVLKKEIVELMSTRISWRDNIKMVEIVNIHSIDKNGVCYFKTNH